MKIGIIGKMCSGKSTLAKNIQKKYNNYVITSFAEKIKILAKELFNMDIKDRKLLQMIGTKMRDINPDVWVNFTIDKFKNNENVIIDDVRYQNEIDKLKKENYLLIYLYISNDVQINRLKNTYKNNYQQHIDNLNHESEKLLLDNDDIDIRIDCNNLNENDIFNIVDVRFMKYDNLNIGKKEKSRNCCINF